MTVGEKIRALRKQHGMTQTELAERLNTTKQTIGKYEQGIVTNLPLYRVQELADVFGVAPEFLVGWEEQKEKPAEDDGLSEKQREFIRLVSQLSDQEVSMLSAQVKGLLQSQGSPGDP